MIKRAWFNYFSNIRKKYNMRASCEKPLIIVLKARNIIQNKINEDSKKEDKIFDCIKRTSKYLTNKFECISICGNMESCFIIENVEKFINSINNEKSYRVQDIASIFSQYYFEYFNSIYDNETVYWNCKCFNIANEKIQSYVKYKSHLILEEITAQFLKQKGIKLRRNKTKRKDKNVQSI